MVEDLAELTEDYYTGSTGWVLVEPKDRHLIQQDYLGVPNVSLGG